MNEIQLTFELAKDIKDLIEKEIPTEEATIFKVSGNTIFLTASPSAIPDIFYGGQLKVTSGDAEGLVTSIVQSAAEQIVVSGAFTGRHCPQPGDTVTIGPGPLQDSIVFMFEPETVAPQNREPYLITVNPYGKRTESRTMNGKQNKGWLSFSKLMDFEVVCESLNTVPDGNDLAAQRNRMYGLKVLSEMMEIIITDFRMDERNRISGDGGLETTYNQIQRTGSTEWRNAAITEFSIKQT